MKAAASITEAAVLFYTPMCAAYWTAIVGAIPFSVVFCCAFLAAVAITVAITITVAISITVTAGGFVCGHIHDKAAQLCFVADGLDAGLDLGFCGKIFPNHIYNLVHMAAQSGCVSHHAGRRRIQDNVIEGRPEGTHQTLDTIVLEQGGGVIKDLIAGKQIKRGGTDAGEFDLVRSTGKVFAETGTVCLDTQQRFYARMPQIRINQKDPPFFFCQAQRRVDSDGTFAFGGNGTGE